MVCFQNLTNAQDTLRSDRPDEKIKKVFKAEPTRATMLAIALPGLGQIYNRKYWKVPFVYAGFGGLAFSVSFYSKNYNEFLKGFQDFTDLVRETDSYLDLAMFQNSDPSTYDPVLYPNTYDRSKEAWCKDRMIKGIDFFKKYRDLSYIGFAIWYLVTILDANVDASLFNYDISDNLDLDVAPVQMPMSGQAGMGLNVSLRVTF